MKAAVTKAVAAAESSPVKAQLFRVARIVAFGVLAALATSTPITVVLVAGVAEAAFRQVFPA